MTRKEEKEMQEYNKDQVVSTSLVMPDIAYTDFRRKYSGASTRQSVPQ